MVEYMLGSKIIIPGIEHYSYELIYHFSQYHISEVGQRINPSFCSSDRFLKFEEIDAIFRKKHALFKENRGQYIKKCFSSSISPVEQ